MIKITYCTYIYNINVHKIEKFNIFRHGSFTQYVYKAARNCKDKADFAKAIRGELQYYFWSKSEYELIVKLTDDNRIFLYPWCGGSNPDNEKIEVTDETDFDWLGFAKEHIDKQIYKNEVKIDIYDQVMFQFDKFIDYVWNHNTK